MKCTQCKSEKSVVGLTYGGSHLCGTCFSRLFEKRVRKTIRINKLLSREDVVAVELSGDVSSATTLYVLRQLSSRLPKTKFFGLTFDDGSSESKKRVAISQKACDKMGLELDIAPGKNDLEKRLGDLKATKLAVGHNLDDEVRLFWENILENNFAAIALMGAGPTKLNNDFTSVIKPLRDTPENEIIAYAKIHDILFVKGRKKVSDKALDDMLEDIEKNHPGSRFQLLKSIDELSSRMG